MKSIITLLAASAALSWPFALSTSSQEPAPPTAPIAAPDVELDEPELADAPAVVQVEVDIRPELPAAAVRAGTQVQAVHRQVEQQFAKARQAIELAQAAAPATPRGLPGALPGAASTPAPALQQRLHAVVNKGRGSGHGKALVIRTSDADAKTQGNLEEDLAVMSRILDKTVAKEMDDERANRVMGINVVFAPGSGSFRNLYLEGYGALFLLNVNFPLLPPPEKPEATKTKSDTDSTWEEAKQELYGQSDAWGQVGKAFKFSMAAGPQQEYDRDKVEDLKTSLLEVLKNATNIRDLKENESITVCVFGGLSAAPGKARTVAKRGPNWQNAEDVEVQVTSLDDGQAARGTIMTFRVRKSDVDAFATGNLDMDDFRKKVTITNYAGDTGGWGGGNVFGTR